MIAAYSALMFFFSGFYLAVSLIARSKRERMMQRAFMVLCACTGTAAIVIEVLR